MTTGAGAAQSPALPQRFAPDGRVAVLRLAPKVTLRRLGKDEGGVLLRLADGQLYTCNDTTVAFLEAVDGRRDLAAIIERVLAAFDATRAELTVDFVELAERLLAEDLIRIDDGAAG
jgi:pyrroloquinoline quinone biosynthesis protein D